MASLIEDRAGPWIEAISERTDTIRPSPDQSGFSAFAQITARCGHDTKHAFALYFKVEDQRVVGIRYSKGGSKLQNLGGSHEIETAMALFCAYAEGAPVSTVRDVTLRQLAGHLDLAAPVALPSPDRAPATMAEQEELRRRLGDPLFCLFTGGAIPFVLFQWALLNLTLKQAVSKVLLVGPGETIRFRSVTDIYRLIDELSKDRIFARRRRGLEMGVRSLHLHSVDESSLRTAYQQDTHREMLREASRRGFLDHFDSVEGV